MVEIPGAVIRATALRPALLGQTGPGVAEPLSILPDRVCAPVTRASYAARPRWSESIDWSRVQFVARVVSGASEAGSVRREVPDGPGAGRRRNDVRKAAPSCAGAPRRPGSRMGRQLVCAFDSISSSPAVRRPRRRRNSPATLCRSTRRWESARGPGDVRLRRPVDGARRAKCGGELRRGGTVAPGVNAAALGKLRGRHTYG